MKPLLRLFMLSGCLFLYCSCTDSALKERPDVSAYLKPVQIVPLDSTISAFRSIESVASYMAANPTLAEHFFNLQRFGNIRELGLSFREFQNSPYNDTLYQDAYAAVNLPAIEQELSQAFAHIRYYYPQWQQPEVYSAVSGFGSYGWGGDVLLHDSLIVLGLDYWGGSSVRYRPPEMPTYILKRFTPDQLVPNVVKLLSSQPAFMAVNQDQTLLSDMLLYGKALLFTEHMVPATPDSLIIGFTAKQLAQSHYNEEYIYRHFVDNELFFEASANVKKAYIGERPTVPEIDKNSPGRIGRWLGWQIVRSYMRNNELSLQAVMAEADLQKIFRESGYRPKRRNK